MEEIDVVVVAAFEEGLTIDTLDKVEESHEINLDNEVKESEYIQALQMISSLESAVEMRWDRMLSLRAFLMLIQVSCKS